MFDLFNFLHIFVPLFVVVDPFAAMILFISYAKGRSKIERLKVVSDATLTSFLILVFFAIFGYYILLYFGISIPALEVAGGILILLTSVEMVTEGDKPQGSGRKQNSEPLGDIGIVPLGTPLLAGPGAISLVIILMHDYSWPLVMLSIILVTIITYLLFMGAFYIYNLIKEKGARALTRVFGVLVAGFAIQYIFTGIALFFHIG